MPVIDCSKMCVKAKNESLKRTKGKIQPRGRQVLYFQRLMMQIKWQHWYYGIGSLCERLPLLNKTNSLLEWSDSGIFWELLEIWMRHSLNWIKSSWGIKTVHLRFVSACCFECILWATLPLFQFQLPFSLYCHVWWLLVPNRTCCRGLKQEKGQT